MKRIGVLSVIVLAAAGGVAYWQYQAEAAPYAAEAVKALLWVWESIKANPVPTALAVGTFLLTVVYYKAKGKSLRESVEAAATRVTVVPVPVNGTADENPVIKRAKARATRTQLLADQIGLQNRLRKLPAEVEKVEKEACYTEQAVADAERALAQKQKLHQNAVNRLKALRREQAEGREELAAIDAELHKLAELV